MIDLIRKALDPLQNKIRLMIGRAIIQAVVDDKEKCNQLLKCGILQNEVRDQIEKMAQYGFASAPLPGAEALIVFPSGDRSQGVCIATEDRRYRLKTLQNGEVALYTDEGDKIHFKRNREILVSTRLLTVEASEKATVTAPIVEVTAATRAKVTSPLVEVIASTKVEITTPLAKVIGNLEVTGTSKLTGLVTATAGITAVGGVSSSGAPVASQITDANGDLGEIRTVYNGHTHPQSGGGTTSAPNQLIT